jgi:hypothetical protein
MGRRNTSSTKAAGKAKPSAALERQQRRIDVGLQGIIILAVLVSVVA